ncbi:asparagine synthase (glutamine-hydrolyzing) [Segetibacter aerophilus]|uniref:asparagine synthase (glutamine-hydrolyzing) n=1 Tax=Segetibacter aerophilus TaxID=670293 RepID=A0A512BD61_9BACT|nr:asparagine synthase (glutamine-hydrolyzing) [Segetibacter aerophilus]GEO09903.1 asparagine synthetase B [Segetibacter aerophilus]
MCGISGIINKSNKAVDYERIKNINDLVSHRGPNGEGFFLAENIAFGHRRLSIIDLSDAGKQPMTYNERYTITFNGEIYNYIEIREQLELLGYIFTSHTDTEVILAAWDKWKEDCFTMFNGMWSFAIYDKIERTVICCRDRFGVKPFYYVNNDEYFVFGSEIKQCLPFLKANEVNLPILIDYLALNITDHSTETFFKNVLTLKGGHYLKYSLVNNEYLIKQFYCISINNDLSNIKYNEASAQFKKEFERSINWRLRSDVTVGTCLSGGLDSSFIAAVAAKKHYSVTNTSFKAITAEAIDDEVNEVNYAKIVSTTANLDLHVTKPSSDDFWSEIDNIIRLHEEPFGGPSIAMQYFVMKEAKYAGITVLLDGQGGDETLLGYPRYVAAMMKGKGLLGKIKILRSASSNYNTSIKDLFRIYFYFTSSLVRKRRIKLKYKNIKAEYLKCANWSFIDQLAAKFANINDLQKFEITVSQIPQLLKWEDKNSMYYSIETRLPFLDWQLLEFNLSLPPQHKIKEGWSKYLIRENMQGLLPEEIAWRRKKLGFNAPIRSWLQKKEEMLTYIKKSEIANAIMDVNQLKIQDTNYLWRTYNLAKWGEFFNVKI